MTPTSNNNTSAQPFERDSYATKHPQRFQSSAAEATDPHRPGHDLVPGVIPAVDGPDPLLLPQAPEVQSPYLSEVAV